MLVAPSPPQPRRSAIENTLVRAKWSRSWTHTAAPMATRASTVDRTGEGSAVRATERMPSAPPRTSHLRNAAVTRPKLPVHTIGRSGSAGTVGHAVHWTTSAAALAATGEPCAIRPRRRGVASASSTRDVRHRRPPTYCKVSPEPVLRLESARGSATDACVLPVSGWLPDALSNRVSLRSALSSRFHRLPRFLADRARSTVHALEGRK